MKVGIVGLGLIGGSLARAIKKAGYTVLGADIDETVLLKAMLLGVIDERLTNENLKECQVVLLGIFPEATLEWLRSHAGHLAKETVVMDSCGVKQAICPEAFRLARENGFVFVGGHPMEGLAKIGFEHSSETLFNRASLILCPDKDITLEQMKKLKDVLDAAGFGRYEITTPEHHDEMIALTSQLAHVVSSAYVKAPLARQHMGYSAGSFKDMTRVAYLNETMWTELFLSNQEHLLNEIDALLERIKPYREALAKRDAQGLCKLLQDGRMAKAAISVEEKP